MLSSWRCSPLPISLLRTVAQTLAPSQVTSKAPPRLISPTMFMWQPSYSEAPNTCSNATPLEAGINSPSRQGTITEASSRSVSTRKITEQPDLLRVLALKPEFQRSSLVHDREGHHAALAPGQPNTLGRGGDLLGAAFEALRLARHTFSFGRPAQARLLVEEGPGTSPGIDRNLEGRGFQLHGSVRGGEECRRAEECQQATRRTCRAPFWKPGKRPSGTVGPNDRGDGQGREGQFHYRCAGTDSRPDKLLTTVE